MRMSQSRTACSRHLFFCLRRNGKDGGVVSVEAGGHPICVSPCLRVVVRLRGCWQRLFLRLPCIWQKEAGPSLISFSFRVLDGGTGGNECSVLLAASSRRR